MDLKSNRITKIDDGTFSQLHNCTDLVLSSNKLKHFAPGMFKGLENLKNLDLENNHINDIRPNSFSNMHSLQRLYLSNNNLTTLGYDAFNYSLSTPLILKLKGNPVNCNRNMCWAKWAESKALIKFETSVKTGWPAASPECTNYPGVHWEDIHLECPATGQSDLVNFKFFLQGINFICW